MSQVGEHRALLSAILAGQNGWCPTLAALRAYQQWLKAAEGPFPQFLQHLGLISDDQATELQDWIINGGGASQLPLAPETLSPASMIRMGQIDKVLPDVEVASMVESLRNGDPVSLLRVHTWIAPLTGENPASESDLNSLDDSLSLGPKLVSWDSTSEQDSPASNSSQSEIPSAIPVSGADTPESADLPTQISHIPDEAARDPFEIGPASLQAAKTWKKPNPIVAPPQTGSDASRYRVVKQHARGGLGVVSVAMDLELNREVALKEIQGPYADDQQSRSRFVLEAEITGGLEHPGIVPIYGLGQYRNGRPYYAMKFIRGQTMQSAIDDYHRQLKKVSPSERETVLKFRQLLRRFIEICQTLHYAHSRGILHRDLKPGNVMLGDYGETLVVDWGLAKPLDLKEEIPVPQPRLKPDSYNLVTPTCVGMAVGTPQYMSPEQATGEVNSLTPQSDIFSLGAILYYLLVGKLAFLNSDPYQVLEDVQQGKFPEPITVQPSTPKALNAICLKAMALKTADRYASAQLLADDVERWLADEPVSAYPETQLELWGRWIRRNQTKVVTVFVSLTIVLVVTIAATYFIRNAWISEAAAHGKLQISMQAETKAKQEAVRRSQQTRTAIDTLLSGVSDALENFPGMQDARRRLLEKAAEDYQKLAEEKSTDPSLQVESARSWLRLGDVRLRLNQRDAAKAAYTEGNKILVQLAGGFPSTLDYQLELGNSLTKQGLAEAALEPAEKAGPYFEQAEKQLGDLLQKNPTSEDVADALATACIGHARHEVKLEKFTRAEELLDQANDALNPFHGAKTDPRLWLTSANVESTRGRSRLDQHHYLEASKAYQDALRFYDRLCDQVPDHPDYFASRATARLQLAEVLRQMGHYSRMVETYRGVHDDLQDVVQALPDVPQYRENLAVARTNLGQALRLAGDNLAALPVLDEAVRDFTEFSESYPSPRSLSQLASTKVSAAQVRSELGQQDEALALIQSALVDYDDLEAVSPNDRNIREGLAQARVQQGYILSRKQQLPEALQAFQQAFEELEQLIKSHPNTPRYRDSQANVVNARSWCLWHAGKKDDAKSAFEQVLKLRQQLTTTWPYEPRWFASALWLSVTCPVEELRTREPLDKLLAPGQKLPLGAPLLQARIAAALHAGQLEPARASLTELKSYRQSAEGNSLALETWMYQVAKDQEAARKSWEVLRDWHQKQRPADEELAEWVERLKSP